MSIEQLIEKNIAALEESTKQVTALIELMNQSQTALQVVSDTNVEKEAAVAKPKKEKAAPKAKVAPVEEPTKAVTGEFQTAEEQSSLFKEETADEITKGQAPTVDDSNLAPWYHQTRKLANRYSRETGNPLLVQQEAKQFGITDLRKADDASLYQLAVRLGELLNVDPMGEV